MSCFGKLSELPRTKSWLKGFFAVVPTHMVLIVSPASVAGRGSWRDCCTICLGLRHRCGWCSSNQEKHPLQEKEEDMRRKCVSSYSVSLVFLAQEENLKCLWYSLGNESWPEERTAIISTFVPWGHRVLQSPINHRLKLLLELSWGRKLMSAW